MARDREADLDSVTGLPALPEDQFWRVTYFYDEGVYGSGWRLELHQRTPTRRRPERSKLLESQSVDYSDSTPHATVLRLTAMAVLEERAERFARARLAGDYPPKRLD